MLAPLPRSGEVTLKASVGEVWDKGAAAVFEVKVECEYFVATWSLFAPGAADSAETVDPSRPAEPQGEPSLTGVLDHSGEPGSAVPAHRRPPPHPHRSRGRGADQPAASDHARAVHAGRRDTRRLRGSPECIRPT